MLPGFQFGMNMDLEYKCEFMRQDSGSCILDGVLLNWMQAGLQAGVQRNKFFACKIVKPLLHLLLHHLLLLLLQDISAPVHQSNLCHSHKNFDREVPISDPPPQSHLPSWTDLQVDLDNVFRAFPAVDNDSLSRGFTSAGDFFQIRFCVWGPLRARGRAPPPSKLPKTL